MKRIALIALALVGCESIEPDDAPELTYPAAANWKALGECIYSDMVTTHRVTPDRINYVNLDGAQTATLRVTDRPDIRDKLQIRVTGAGEGRSVVTVYFGYMAHAGNYPALANAALTNCGVIRPS